MSSNYRPPRGLKPRPTARPASSRPARSFNSEERKMAVALDELALFQDLRADLIPALQSLIENKAPTKEILDKGRAAALARLVSMAVLEADSKTALSAIKELLDRSEGKATERKEISHRLEKLPDEEVDALLLTSISDLEDSSDADDN